MARIEVASEDRVSEEAREILKEIEQGIGRVPNLFKTYAHHTPLLRANWQKLKSVMMEGALPRKLKEVIALLVSQDNGCEYSIRAHSGGWRCEEAAIGAAQSQVVPSDNAHARHPQPCCATSSISTS